MENCKAEFLYEEKKSKFFSYYFQIDVADEIEQILKNVRADNKKATHVCFAVKFAGDNFVCKCSDDGEPSGTAGRPILNVLEKQNRKNCMEADQNEEKSSGLFLFAVMWLENFLQKRIIK